MCDLFGIMAKKKEEVAPLYIEHKVPHYSQMYNWDCGVTCVLMLLSTEQRRELLARYHEICAEEGFYQSTWTIDLCYLLKRFDIKHEMFTTMPGVNEDYRKHEYYDKIIDMDRARVSSRFAGARRAGVRVARSALCARALAAHVAARGPALVLVDAPRLACERCKRNKLSAELRRWFGGAYRGHYILVVGVSRGRLLYRDPATPAVCRDSRTPQICGDPKTPQICGNPKTPQICGDPKTPPICQDPSTPAVFRDPTLCVATPASFARARAASGTDHDVILIYKDYR